MPDLFGQLLNKPYAGMYPGSNPYDKAMMMKEGIPSADQEALKEPTVDPIKAGAIAASGGGMAMMPGGAVEAKNMAGSYLINGLFGYLLNQSIMKGIDKVRSTPIDELR